MLWQVFSVFLLLEAVGPVAGVVFFVLHLVPALDRHLVRCYFAIRPSVVLAVVVRAVFVLFVVVVVVALEEDMALNIVHVNPQPNVHIPFWGLLILRLPCYLR